MRNCALAAVFATTSLVVLSGCGGNSATGLAGSACVSGVQGVNAGPKGSLYIQDSRGIVHYSKTGKILARFGPKTGDWTVDRSGDVYFLQGQDIVKTLPSGSVLARWHAPKMEPEAVNPANGDVMAVYGGQSYTGTGPDLFELLSPSGAIIERWSPSYSGNIVFDSQGDIVVVGDVGSDIEAVDPKTGKTLFKSALASPAVGSDDDGHVYAGYQNSSDTPFTLGRVTIAGRHFHFKSLNTSEQSVGGLTVATDGTIYVVRSSYAQSSSTDTGLEALSPSGSSLGAFAACK